MKKVKPVPFLEKIRVFLAREEIRLLLVLVVILVLIFSIKLQLGLFVSVHEAGLIVFAYDVFWFLAGAIVVTIIRGGK